MEVKMVCRLRPWATPLIWLASVLLVLRLQRAATVVISLVGRWAFSVAVEGVE